jgi:hypothetical protein
MKSARTNPRSVRGRNTRAPKTARTNPGPGGTPAPTAPQNRANEPRLGASQNTRAPKRRERTQRWALWASYAGNPLPESRTNRARDQNGANEPNVSLVKFVKI